MTPIALVLPLAMISSVVSFILGLVLGAAIGYLVLRNNPAYREWLDSQKNPFDKNPPPS